MCIRVRVRVIVIRVWVWVGVMFIMVSVRVRFIVRVSKQVRTPRARSAISPRVYYG